MSKKLMKLYGASAKPSLPDIVSVCGKFKFPHCPEKNEWVFPGGVSFADRRAAERHSKKVIEQYKSVKVNISGQSCSYSDNWGKKRRGIVLKRGLAGLYAIRSKSGRTVQVPSDRVILLRDSA